MKSILQVGAKMLRKKASVVSLDVIQTKKIKNLINDMHEALASQKDGVALAAPQIGISLQIFVVAPFVAKNYSGKMVYINPSIIKLSDEKKFLSEGCLSCRWKTGEVERSLSVTVEASNEKGEKFREEGNGLLAHIFQHEIDHLHGILFIDKARNLREMSKEEQKF